MCGIYGFIGRPTKETRFILRELGMLNEDRGKDSAGCAVIYPSRFYLYKQIVNSSKFWDLKHPQTLVGIGKNCKPCIFIGHARHATNGAITKENAHPYRIGKIIMAHNGIIDNFAQLQTEHKTNYQVDSQIIGHLLATQGQLKTFNSDLKGWYAVPYVNLNHPETLKIARHGAPLSFGVNKSGIYFTSDIEHLKMVNVFLDKKLVICKTSNDTLYTLKSDGAKRIKKTKLTPPIEYYHAPYTWDFEDYYFGHKTDKKESGHNAWLPKGAKQSEPKKSGDFITPYFGHGYAWED